MGHTNALVRFFWKRIVQEKEDPATNVMDVLSQYVGLLPDTHNITLSQKLVLPMTIEIAREYALISSMPIQVPLFTLQREAIYRLLDKLRLAGLLTQILPFESKE